MTHYTKTDFDDIEYGVRCMVSGGVTGTREAWLRKDNKIAVFASAAEAEAEATRLVLKMNSGINSARFQYWAEAF